MKLWEEYQKTESWLLGYQHCEIGERCVVDIMGRLDAGEYNMDCNRQDTYVW
jgi:hypothetical protein